MSVNSTFSSSAPAFAPAGMQQAYYYGYSYNYYHTAQCQAYASSPVNLDDFSDLSDSDTEEPKKAPPSPISRSAQRLDTEPEPLPEPRQLESDTSSISSEPEKEVDDELDASSTMSMDEVEFEEKTIYSVHELLQCRSKLHQEPWIIYQTQKVKAPKPEESPSPTARSSRRTASGSESIARSITSILNKLTLEKFQALSQQLLSCGISTAQHVEVLIREIFDKATTQHHFIDMYADLCVVLHEHFVSQPLDCEKSFKRLLLEECQCCFERLLAPPVDLEDLAVEEKQNAARRYKTSMLGNIKLVGSLLARGMLASKVGIAILEELLSNATNETLESTAALLTAMGSACDRPSWPQKVALDGIFKRVAGLVAGKSCQPRERFLLKDLLELRANGWEEKRPKALERQMTLAQVAKLANGQKVEPKAMRCLQPAVFDQDRFRQQVLGLLKEADASALELAQSVPAAAQRAQVCHLLGAVVELPTEQRQKALQSFLKLAEAWPRAAVAEGLQDFALGAEDLATDVPLLPRIFQQELRPSFAQLGLPEVNFA
eukprot:CAMPEP_0181445594 /NCGR_PEP_ID=MMETSP1110-20121109/25669_1 /TAXON_ID=174948 /ORGANISM="Symbiodinium sp., Strain CCMP421" /LENGTH=546 /DNA_ID=CAMNT_0023569645 /DNA_START=87 /DNA_END=1727 /DNA_ORIENTATION=+